MAKYSKAIAMVVATIASAIVAANADNTLTNVEWINVAIAGVFALGVFAAPNVPHAPVTKAVLAVLAAVLTLLTSLITDGISSTEWLQLLIAGLGALGVYELRNRETTANRNIVH